MSEFNNNGFTGTSQTAVPNFYGLAVNQILIDTIGAVYLHQGPLSTEGENAKQLSQRRSMGCKQNLLGQGRDSVGAVSHPGITLNLSQANQLRGQIRTGVPVDGVLVKKTGCVGAGSFLTVVNHGKTLLEIIEGGPVAQHFFIAADLRCPGAVVIFKAPEFHIVVRIHALLTGYCRGILSQRNFTGKIVRINIPDVVIVAAVESLIQFTVGMCAVTLGTVEDDKPGLYGLCQPETAGADFFDFFPCFQPEINGYHGGNIAAETIHDFCPHFQGFNLIVPQTGLGVVQIDDVRPVTHAVTEGTVCFLIEPFRMILGQPGIGGGVVVDNIDDTLHAVSVDIINQTLEIIHGTEFGIDSTIIGNGIGTAQATFTSLHTQRVNGHQPDNIGSQGFDPIKILPDTFEGSLLAVVADKDGVEDLVAVGLGGRFCHVLALLAFSCSYHTPIFRKKQLLQKKNISVAFNRFIYYNVYSY